MELKFEPNGKVSPEEIAQLRESVGWETKGDYGKILENSHFYVVTRDGDKLVGFVNLAGGVAGDCLIYDLCVHPDYQRKGIATRMIHEVIEYCKGNSINGLNVLFEEKNRPFFQRLGFRMMQGGYLDIAS
jgi:GNAT superfamily N-acetyltransferase